MTRKVMTVNVSMGMTRTLFSYYERRHDEDIDLNDRKQESSMGMTRKVMTVNVSRGMTRALCNDSKKRHDSDEG